MAKAPSKTLVIIDHRIVLLLPDERGVSQLTSLLHRAEVVNGSSFNQFQFNNSRELSTEGSPEIMIRKVPVNTRIIDGTELLALPEHGTRQD